MSDRRFQAGAEKSPYDLRDWKSEVVYATVGTPEFTLPEEFSTESHIFAPRNQGVLGSCVGFSVSVMKDFQEKLDDNITEPTSPLYIYNLRSNKPGYGMYPRNAMDILLEYGIPLESEYPYINVIEAGEQSPPLAVMEKAKARAIESYAQVTSIRGLKESLIKNGPCLVTVKMYNYSLKLWEKRHGDYFLGRHALTVIGYNKEGFILRNSWGKSWGNSGNTLIPYNDFGALEEIWTSIDGNTAALYKKNSVWQRKVKSFLWHHRSWVIPVGVMLLAAVGVGVLLWFSN